MSRRILIWFGCKEAGRRTKVSRFEQIVVHSEVLAFVAMFSACFPPSCSRISEKFCLGFSLAAVHMYTPIIGHNKNPHTSKPTPM